MTDTKMPDLLREIVAYCREAGHDWFSLDEADRMLAALDQASTTIKSESNQCAQCKKPYHQKLSNTGCTKCAPGVSVSEDEFRKPITVSETNALAKLKFEDVKIEVLTKQTGGFAPITSGGIKLTHVPSGISVVVDGERSQHKNRQLAWEKLTALVATTEHELSSQPLPTECKADPANPGWCVGCNPDNCIGCGIGLDNMPTEHKVEPNLHPVAWIHDWSESSEEVDRILSWSPESPHPDKVTVIPLYTSPQVPEDRPLMVFAIECEMGALQEHEIPIRARQAIYATRKKNL